MIFYPPSHLFQITTVYCFLVFRKMSIKCKQYIWFCPESQRDLTEQKWNLLCFGALKYIFLLACLFLNNIHILILHFSKPSVKFPLHFICLFPNQQVQSCSLNFSSFIIHSQLPRKLFLFILKMQNKGNIYSLSQNKLSILNKYMINEACSIFAGSRIRQIPQENTTLPGTAEPSQSNQLNINVEETQETLEAILVNSLGGMCLESHKLIRVCCQDGF